MPNTYFRFRQFTVHQEKSAMKVCTDACLFGAWVADVVEGTGGSILDIGSGTGLLSLMLAQKTAATIDAVEIDNDAFTQASENFSASAWHERLSAHHLPVQQYHPADKYDLIITNPPFYANDLRSENEKRNVALHGISLSFDDLLASVDSLTRDNGMFTILLPYRRCSDFELLVKRSGWNIYKKAIVKQSTEHKPFRCMYMLSRLAVSKNTEEISIRAGSSYSKRFNDLLKDYYLFEKNAEHENYS
jgi:tRNA1Val (adenine37-N6)-methyltransferase